MRVLARIGCALAGLALMAPMSARAGLPAFQSAKAKKAAAKTTSTAEKLCANCVRNKLMAEKGVNVPPPPPLPAGTVISANMCTRCGQPVAVLAGPLPPSRSLPGPAAPGMMMAGEAPGYASTMGDIPGGMDPAPIGSVQPRLAAATNIPMPNTRLGLRDAAVMPTSTASEPIVGPEANRPHVISHMIGITAIGRTRREERERRRRESHASIPYGTIDQTVQELPSRMVYGRGVR